MTLTSNQRNWTVFFAAAALIAIASAAYLGLAGNTDDNIRLLLRLSARIAFLVLLVIFILRPMRQFIATPLTTKLVKNRRLFGVAFAGVHTAHLALIFYRAEQVADFQINVFESAPGVVTYLLIYLMFLTSFDRPARAMGRNAWKILHKVGLYWIFAVFLQTQLPNSFDNLADVNWWLVTLIVLALVIRITAFIAKRPPRAQPL